MRRHPAPCPPSRPTSRPPQITHFEGERGVERKVRVVLSNGSVAHYEGGQGEERAVRVVLSG